VQLSDVTQGYHLWSERFDRDLKDIFAVQDEIAAMIAARLSVKLLATPAAPLRPPSRNLEAYDLYLRGRYLVQQRGASMAQALQSFHDAIMKDPRYALPYTGVAEAYPVLALYEVVPSAMALTRARVAADRALALDPDLMEAQQAAGVMEFYLGWNLERAEQHLRQAIELAPRAASPRLYLAQLLSFSNRKAEALAEVRVALELEPLSPLYLLLAANAVSAAGDTETGEHLAAQATEAAPDYVAAHYITGLIQLMRGRNESAAQSFGKGLQLFPATALLKALRGMALANLGRTGEAEGVVAELERGTRAALPLGIGPTAALLWHLGRSEPARQLFERAFEDHAVLAWSYPLWVPGLSGLAAEPWWQVLLETAGLTHLVSPRD
jgi:serine/threonine-protein kinase